MPDSLKLPLVLKERSVIDANGRVVFSLTPESGLDLIEPFLRMVNAYGDLNTLFRDFSDWINSRKPDPVNKMRFTILSDRFAALPKVSLPKPVDDPWRVSLQKLIETKIAYWDSVWDLADARGESVKQSEAHQKLARLNELLTLVKSPDFTDEHKNIVLKELQ